MENKPVSMASESASLSDTGNQKKLRRAVAAISIFALCIDSLTVRSVVLLAPFIRSGLHLDNDQVGYVMAAMVAGTMVIVLPVGSIISRLDTRKTFSVIMVAVGLAFMGIALQHSLWGLLLTLFILGLLRAGIIPLVNRVVAEHFSSNQRGRILGVVYAAVPLGGFLGAVGLPALAELIDWNASFRFLGITALLGGFLIWWLTPKDGSARPTVQPRYGSKSFVTIPFVILCVSYTLLALSMSGEMFVTLYLVDVTQISATLAGTFFGLIQLTGTGGRLFWGYLADRYFSTNRWSLLAITSGLIVISYLLLIGLKPGSPWWIIAGIMILLGMSVASSWVILTTLVGDVVRIGSVAIATATIFFLTNITDMSGSVIYGTLLERTQSYQVTLILFIGLAALASLIFTVMAVRTARQRTPSTPELS